MKIYLYDDWRQNPNHVIQEIFDFLGVDSNFQPDMGRKQNVSFTPKNVGLYKFLSRPNPLKSALKAILPKKLRQSVATKAYKNNVSKPPKLDPAVRQEVLTLFESDILKLQDQLDRDLSHWLSP